MRSTCAAAILFSFAALSGCATTQKPANNETASNTEVVCHEEATTGSNIGHQVCRTRQREERDRDVTQRVLQKSVPAHPPPSNGK